MKNSKKPIQAANDKGKTKSSQNLDDRRNFLTKTGVLLASLGAGGLTTLDAAAQDLSKDQGKILQAVFDRAITNKGDVKAAIKSVPNAETLPKEVTVILSSLTRQDWQNAMNLKRKLEDLRVNQLASNTNGVIGM